MKTLLIFCEHFQISFDVKEWIKNTELVWHGQNFRRFVDEFIIAVV